MRLNKTYSLVLLLSTVMLSEAVYWQTVLSVRRVVTSDGGSSYQRSAVRGDGQGNSSRRYTRAAEGSNGGQAYQVSQAKRLEDGSASKTVTTGITGANGAYYNSEKQLNRDADGNLSASRTISGETRNGKSYNAEVSVADGQVTRSQSCSDSSGNAVACR